MNIAVAEGCHYYDTVWTWLYVPSCVVSIYPSCEVVLILSDLKEFFSISMSDFREALWKNNADLKEALLKYVGQRLQRWEMLDFLTRDFPLYAWSLRMLDRRLRHFDIFFNDSAVKVDHVMKAFETEPNGPGKLLEYHAMHKKIRQ